ncbi:MAG: hypothetical protein RLZZ546_1488 [Bacteroidota bacterium]|jgi:cell division septation protein DedD
MGRVLKIISIAVVIFLAYMWVSVLKKSFKNNREKEIVTAQAKDKETEFTEETFFDEDTIAEKNDAIDYKKLDETVKSIETKKEVTSTKETVLPSNTTTKTVSNPTKISSDANIGNTQKKTETIEEVPIGKGGSFIVVAGNYLVEGNANEMVKKLKKNGFSNAEKVVFDLSEFFTAIAGRYPSQESANKAVSKLKEKGIDAYVNKKK